MAKKKPKLYKTVIVIWTDTDPTGTELVDLAREATDGGAICTQQTSSRVDANLCPRRDFFIIEDVDSFCDDVGCDHKH